MTTKTEERAIASQVTRDQFDRLTKNITAYAVSYRGSNVAKVTFIERDVGQDGTQVRCFIHILGIPMVEGEACGGGYDIWSAAFSNATTKLDGHSDEKLGIGFHVDAFVKAAGMDNQHWDGALRNLGKNSHDIFQVI